MAHGAALGIDVPAGGCGAHLRGHVGENDDGEFEPLRFVHGHQAHAVAALFENRRLAGLAVFGLLAQLLDESAERNPSIRLVTARELGDVKHIRQHLLAAMLERKPHVRARGLEQRRNRRRNGTWLRERCSVCRSDKRLDDRERSSAGRVCWESRNGWKWPN